MKNITLNEVKFLQLLPQWMQNDDTDKSIAESLDKNVKDICSRKAVLSKWNDAAIDAMSEKHLDLLAYELNITWYLYDASIERKRKIVKEARHVHWKLGTKWAIEYVLSIYFTSAEVHEWFEYGGEPGHFKVTSKGEELHRNDATFVKVLNSVKRFSQHFDEVEVEREYHGTTYLGVALAGSYVRNVITSTFNKKQTINQTAYPVVGRAEGFVRNTIIIGG